MLEQIELLRVARRAAEHGNIGFAQAPGAAQYLAALTGVEQLAVDAVGEQLQMGKAVALQGLQLVAGGHQGELGVVVEPAQVALQQVIEGRQQVAGREAVGGAGQATDHGDVQLCSHAQGRQAERAGAGDIQHIRALAAPMALQFGL